MRPVVGAQLRKDVLDVALDGVFRQHELVGNNLVGVPSRNQAQHLHLPCGQRIVNGVVGQLRRHLRADAFAAGVHVADGVQKLLLQEALEQVRLRAGFERPHRLDVAAIRRQDDDACAGEFTANGHERVDAVDLRHLHVHQRDVRLVSPKQLNRLASVRRLRHQSHVWLRGKQGGDPSSQQCMVVDGQNSNRLGARVHGLVPLFPSAIIERLSNIILTYRESTIKPLLGCQPGEVGRGHRSSFRTVGRICRSRHRAS